MAFSEDGKRAVLANSYFLGTWDAKTGEQVHTRFTVPGGAKCVAIARDGSKFAAYYKESLQIWDGTTGDALTKPIPSTDEVKQLRFSPDGSILMGQSEKCVRFWDVATGEPLTAQLKGDHQYGFGSGGYAFDVTSQDSLTKKNGDEEPVVVGSSLKKSSLWDGVQKRMPQKNSSEAASFTDEHRTIIKK